MWKEGLFLELVREAELCDRNLPKSSGEMTSEKESKIFSDLILQGRLREAVRFITDRQGGGVMDPNDDAGKPSGKTVLQVLKDKHPEQRIPDEDDFMACEALPVLVEIEITNAHVEKAARKMFGSAGISGFDAFQLQGLLLRHGKHSEKIPSSFVKAKMRQANQIIAWEEIRALKAKRLISLNKLPGVRPIGIGEAPDRCFEKVMSIVTGEDVMDACGADQLCSGVKSGIEGAVHAIDQTFMQNCDDGWGPFAL